MGLFAKFSFEPSISSKKIAEIKPQIEPVQVASTGSKEDIDKIAYAIAMAETGDCTTGMGKTKKNCFGIMHWPGGVRTGKTYATKEDSYADFKRIWQKHYGGFPTRSMAVKWTGNDNPDQWLANVTKYYYE